MNNQDIDDDNPYEDDYDLNRKPQVNPYSDAYRDWFNRFDPYWR